MASREEWGNITWNLFHGIVEKIKEDKFSQSKELIIKIIKLVCGYLPCPECSQDATKSLNAFNFNLIRSKTDLKNFLYNFHNSINKKTKKQEFKREELDIKYKNINLIEIINNFFRIYSKNNRSEKMMMHNLGKKKFLQILKNNLILLINNLEK